MHFDKLGAATLRFSAAPSIYGPPLMPYYPERINEHFLSPRNVGEARDADAAGEAWAPECGALLRLSLRVNAPSQTITEAKFKAVGCGFLIACASALTETIDGLTLGRAATLPDGAITDWFEELPEGRHHCAALCREALHSALRDYHAVHAQQEWAGEEALICTCFGVSEETIEREVRARSLSTVEQVTRACNAGGGCGSCHQLILDILEDHSRTAGGHASGPGAARS